MGRFYYALLARDEKWRLALSFTREKGKCMGKIENNGVQRGQLILALAVLGAYYNPVL